MVATEWTLRIPGWIPASVNKLTNRSHWAVKKTIKDADYNAIAGVVMISGMEAASGRRRVHVHVVYPMGQRRCDRDNLVKSTLDALVRAGAIKQDSPKWVECVVTDSRDEFAEVPTTYITISEA